MLIGLALLAISQIVSAQSRKITCPTLVLNAPSAVIEGEVVTLSASLTGKGLPAKLTFHWVLTAGEIVSGQGSNTIQIKTDNLGGAYVTATVEIKGLNAACSITKSESFAVKSGCPTLTLEPPSAPVEEGQMATLTAKVAGGGAKRITFHWMVSAGKIRNGQATAAIEVDTNKLGGVGILAAVELGGLAPSCKTFDVVAVMIAKKVGKRPKTRTETSQ